MIHTPNLKALKYVGEEPQRFKQLVSVRVFPILEKGDIVIVPALTAHMMRKNSDFVEVDLNDLYAVEDVIDPAGEIYVDPALDTAFDAPLDHTAGNIPLNEAEVTAEVSEAPAEVTAETPTTKPRGSVKGK